MVIVAKARASKTPETTRRSAFFQYVLHMSQHELFKACQNFYLAVFIAFYLVWLLLHHGYVEEHASYSLDADRPLYDPGTRVRALPWSGTYLFQE